MEPAEVDRAVHAARSTAAELGHRVEDAVVVHSSNRIAVRLTPCDVLARVGPLSYHAGLELELEVEVAHELARAGAPVAEPDPRADPRVHVRDDFALTLWTYYRSVPPRDIGPAEYADALARLHAGMRGIGAHVPHFTDRVADAQRLLADRVQTPDLLDADRELLSSSLRDLSGALVGRGADQQVLHGEPHLGNVLRTRRGLLFVDLETCCRGPVEFDMAHGLLPNEDRRTLTADELSTQCPAADPGAIDESSTLIWAMITTWRWRHDDELPNRRHWRTEGLNRLRSALGRTTGGRVGESGLGGRDEEPG